jgi:hypothetical protein
MDCCASLPTTSLLPADRDDIQRFFFPGQVEGPGYPFIRESTHGDGTQSQGGFFKINSKKETGLANAYPVAIITGIIFLPFLNH